MLCFIKTAFVQEAVADAVVSIRQGRSVFAFFQLYVFKEPVSCLCVVFLVESSIAQVIVCQCIHFVVCLARQLQVFVEVAGGFLHPVQPVVRFATPVKGIRLYLSVILADGDRSVEIPDGLFKRSIGKSLRTQLEQDSLFGFQNACTRMCDTVNRF